MQIPPPLFESARELVRFLLLHNSDVVVYWESEEEIFSWRNVSLVQSIMESDWIRFSVCYGGTFFLISNLFRIIFAQYAC
jgi:hypothetical protein